MASKHDLVPESTPGESQNTVTTRTMELVVAVLFMLCAALVMYDSVRVGIGWGSEGPQAGYFPFYVGLIMLLASAVTFGMHLFGSAPDRSNFVARPALWLVLKVLLPSALYILIMYWVGLYVASAIFIAFFMMWLGRYSIVKAAPVAILVPLVLFWVFERAFLIPLPKGPLEALLGY
ncbi:MAG: tripartite tricarboxylate transporter TctB family protein [Parvibaculaceae bacterium]